MKRFSENTANTVPTPEHDEDGQLPTQKMLHDFLVFIQLNTSLPILTKAIGQKFSGNTPCQWKILLG